MRKKKVRQDLPEEKSFIEQIVETVKDVYYISETDSELFPFVGERAEDVSAEIILKQLGRNDPVEERNFEDLFKRLTEIQEWFGDEETRTANRFSELKEILMKNLRSLKVFKIGRIEIDIYIVGLDADNILKGVWTKAVET
ncbi:nuclease A inhibitor family protein [soil metagenome]